MRLILNIAIFDYLLSISGINGQPVSYKVGEKIEYTIHYGFINGGTASLELTEEES